MSTQRWKVSFERVHSAPSDPVITTIPAPCIRWLTVLFVVFLSSGNAFAQRDLVHQDMIKTLEAYAIYKVGDFEEAFVAWKILAEEGNAQGMLNVANMYQAGEGVDQNMEEALRWYKKGAERGDPLAMYSLAQAYQDGKGVSVDFRVARQLYERAAGAGSRAAQRRLADVYQREGDLERAHYWLQRAADGGDWEAHKQIANLSDRPHLSPEVSANLRQKIVGLLNGFDDAANARDADLLLGGFTLDSKIVVRLPGHSQFKDFETHEYQGLWESTFSKSLRYRFNRDRFDIQMFDDFVQVQSRIFEYITTNNATQVLQLDEEMILLVIEDELVVKSVSLAADLLP